jgi:transposase
LELHRDALLAWVFKGVSGTAIQATLKRQHAWALVMTLAHSRNQYVEFVWDQTVAIWLVCYRRAFERFVGVQVWFSTLQSQSSSERLCSD